MRLRYSIPLPGPFSVGGGVNLGGGGKALGYLFVLPIMLLPYLLLGEAWLMWWCLKPWYIAGVLVHRKVTGRPTPIWRSRNGWW
ncbi:hypothetical protein ACIOFV_07460 [Streptomyces mirabilis]|uniref:hypothetical protein n=1 Tax=Streptomyces mirabilis TaxID=68239 RepID=UPI000C6FFE4E